MPCPDSSLGRFNVTWPFAGVGNLRDPPGRREKFHHVPRKAVLAPCGPAGLRVVCQYGPMLPWLLTKTLWIVPLVLLVAIAIVILRRKLVGVFPFFFGYTVVVSVREFVLLFLKYPGNAYSFVWFLGEALAVLLSLGVIFETLRHILPPYPFLGVVVKLVWILGGMAALAALLMLILPGPRTGPDPLLESIFLLERAARFLQACLLIIVIALMSRFGLTWHQYSIGIIAGFGIYSALDLVTLEFRSHHLLGGDAFELIRSAAYNLGAVIWAAYFLPSLSRTPVEHLPRTNLAEWNEAVADYVDPWYRRS
jgi:hypothetical protein